MEKITHALVPGNTSVIKPAEQTPLVALYLASLLVEVGNTTSLPTDRNTYCRKKHLQCPFPIADESDFVQYMGKITIFVAHL